MCGIAGFWGDFSAELLDRMNQKIAHRGPDGQGSYFDQAQGVGLGHRRLSIIDLSERGGQPMWDAAKRAVITFNGEIYNYRELRRDLEAAGFIFNSDSDTEVLLNLYLHEGVDMLQALNGIFAFALWDPSKQALFIARDHLGIKPLYYAATAKGLLFSSEIKALLECTIVDKTLSPEAFAYTLTYLWTPAPRTIFKHVHKLEPGHAMWFEKGELTNKWCFYDLPYDMPQLNYTEGQAAQHVAQAVEEAVRRQLVADVEVGSFLSGGLDSSAVTAMAVHHTDHNPFKSFTIGSKKGALKDEGFAEDLPYAQKVAGHLGCQLHEVMVGPDMFQDLSFMIRHLDEPQVDLAPLNVFFISKLAREHGIKVLLSGAGGDDIFTGYRRHLALQWERWWSWLPRNVRGGIRSLTGALPLGLPIARRLAKMFQGADLSQRERIANYFHWIRKEALAPLFNADLHDEIAQLNLAAPMLDSLDRIPDSAPPLSQMMYLEAKHFMCDHNLAYTDKMSMATGVEVRVPLLDRDLVELAVRLPFGFKQKGSCGKYIFKRAMEPYLPRDVIYRPKTGFGAPVRSWLLDRNNPLVRDVLSEQTIEKRGIFSAAGVTRLKNVFWHGKADAAYTLLGLACLELWMREFVD